LSCNSPRNSRSCATRRSVVCSRRLGFMLAAGSRVGVGRPAPMVEARSRGRVRCATRLRPPVRRPARAP
jgi:hypothetical protein